MEKKRILIVDDDADIRFMMNYFLSAKGYQVDMAADGQEALEILAGMKTSPDYILLDWIMPVMNGKMFLTYLSQTNPEAFNKTNFIVFSGLDIQPDFPKLGQSFHLLMKPFSIEQLLQLLKKPNLSRVDEHCS